MVVVMVVVVVPYSRSGAGGGKIVVEMEGIGGRGSNGAVDVDGW